MVRRAPTVGDGLFPGDQKAVGRVWLVPERGNQGAIGDLSILCNLAGSRLSSLEDSCSGGL